MIKRKKEKDIQKYKYTITINTILDNSILLHTSKFILSPSSPI